MEDKHNREKRESPKEPNISELEKWLESFRHVHGHDKLLFEIEKITGNHDKKQSVPEKKEHELKISDIEKIFHIFKQKHDQEKLEKSVTSLTQDTKKEKIPEQPKHIVYKADESLSSNKIKAVNTKDILRDLKNTVFGLPTLVKNKLKYKRYRYPAIALGVFLGIYLLFNLPLIYTRISWKKPADSQKMTVRTQEVVQKKMADSAALAPGEVVPAESRVVVPKIGVNAPIVYADTKDEKAIEGLLHSGVVHYQGTAPPGTVGNSFITGHSSNYWWDTGKYNQVFVMLDKLEPGDQAVIYNNGKKFVYTVRDKAVVAPEDISVLAPTDTPVLSLMTCTPPGTSWKRLVVRFDITDPVFYKPETVTNEKTIEPQKKEKKSFFSNVLSFLIPN
ncbi:MAG: class E sortase [Patescibacteria group bacterium]